MTHRSISPITMSMLALIAITSESECPSTIFGIADKFTNDGGTVTLNGTSGTHSIQAGNEDFYDLTVNGAGSETR